MKGQAVFRRAGTVSPDVCAHPAIGRGQWDPMRMIDLADLLGRMCSRDLCSRSRPQWSRADLFLIGEYSNSRGVREKRFLRLMGVG